MDIEAQKRQAAARALDCVRPGMRLGLGHRLDRPALRRAARRARARGPRCRRRCRPRKRPAPEAERLGIPLTTLDETPELDLTVDGADEIGPDLTPDQGRRRRAAARKDRRRGLRRAWS